MITTIYTFLLVPCTVCNCSLVSESEKCVTTPTSQLQHVLKVAQAVTTSTPTHPACGWSLFQEQGVESPLSEIETTESPAQSIDNDVRTIFRFDSIHIHVPFQCSKNSLFLLTLKPIGKYFRITTLTVFYCNILCSILYLIKECLKAKKVLLN